MIDKQDLQRIDACRPDSNDLLSSDDHASSDDLVSRGDRAAAEILPLAARLNDDARLREVYQRVQAFDRRLTSAVTSGMVPPGLADRILERLAADQAVPLEQAVPPVQAELTLPTPLERATRRSPRRRWLMAGAAAAASLLLAAGWLWYQQPAVLPGGELTAEAAEWFERLPAQWQAAAKAPADFPFAKKLSVVPQGWQALSKAAGRRGIVYDLSQRGGPRAALFVLAGKQPQLPTGVPGVPQFTSGGVTVAAWQSGKVIYVLVVAGSEQAYRRLIDPSQRQPLA